MKILVTGVAGFIGFHLSARLLARGDTVVGLDNLNDYYDVTLKKARLARLQEKKGFTFFQFDLADRTRMEALFAQEQFDRVVNLAAQAGVRYSIDNPHAYVESNMVGFLHILEGCRAHPVEHLVYASSSSVYGGNTQLPFSESQSTDHPLSLYAASKKTNELMAHTYSHLYHLPTTGLRFFTVYGPWGRPDMALFLFTRNILAGKPISVFNYGKHKRDFTYIDDIIEGVVRVLDLCPVASTNQPESGVSRVYNIGNNQPVDLMDYIHTLEEILEKKAIIELKPLQPGDVPDTYADLRALEQAVDFRPKTTVREGIQQFVAWYQDYYGSDYPGLAR